MNINRTQASKKGEIIIDFALSLIQKVILSDGYFLDGVLSIDISSQEIHSIVQFR